MVLYEIVETDEGLTVAEFDQGVLPEDAAAQVGGTVVNAGPFESYGEAYDALLSLAEAEDDDEEGKFPGEEW
jgi:hypothetical protein